MSATDPIAATAPAPRAAADSTYRLRHALEATLVPLLAILAATLLFCAFLLTLDRSPADFFELIWAGAFEAGFLCRTA